MSSANASLEPISVRAMLRSHAKSIAQPLAGVSVGLAVWWLLTSPTLHSNVITVSFSPERTALALAELLGKGTLYPHIMASLRRVTVGLLIALLCGLPMGIVIGLSRGLEASTSLLFQILRMISPLSWMPLAVMAFGIGDQPVYFLLAVGAVWPIMLNTAAGVHAMNRQWIRLANSLCASRAETIRLVVLPAIAPQVLTGFRLALGVVWIVLVPAEMLGVSSGLGYFVLDTRDRLAYPELMAAILVIGLLGFALDSLIKLLIRLWVPAT
ncbi:MAG: ABC transporter permease [Candidatus Korobacteraceae bacterium]